MGGSEKVSLRSCHLSRDPRDEKVPSRKRVGGGAAGSEARGRKGW